MKRPLLALAIALLVLPASAQVEIRGLTIAPPDRPGNGGIMLKSVISTRLPGEISALWRDQAGIFATISDRSYRLALRNGELVYETASVSEPKVAEFIVTDLDGDGDPEAVRIEQKDAGSQLIVSRWGRPNIERLAMFTSDKELYFLGFIELMRSFKPQIIYTHGPDHCVRLLVLQDQNLTDVGSLSCGAALAAHPVVADIDGDHRVDLIVARKPDRIEIFLR